MYNGQPPFPGAPPTLPPFPPPRPPVNGNGAPMPIPQPGGFPPFRPPPAGFMPPFAPNFAPGSMPMPMPTLPMNGSPTQNQGFPPTPGSGSMPFRPPPGAGIPQKPSHPGLGATSSPGGSSGGLPGFVKDVKTSTVFLGGISPGIRDDTLRDLLNACGPLHELKRGTDAKGAPQKFGFAFYENPEVVLRAIRCLNGVELPDTSPEGRKSGNPPKALVVKADQKTQEFLEEFESTLGRSDNDEEADAACRKSIQHIIALLTDPNAQHPDGAPKRSGGQSPIEVIVPAHLQDLKEGDLPESQRVVVLDQIAIFRENSARREKEKKQIEDERERFKASPAGQNLGRGSHGGGGGGSNAYGYGNRGLGKMQQQAEMRQWGQQGQQTPQSHQQQQQQNGNGAGPSKARDPQAYDKPVAFVRAETAEAKVESDRTDEEEEELRRQRRQREKDLSLRDAERRTENRERVRIEALNRELTHRQAQADLIERTRRRQEELYATFDDDEVAERGRELFFTDRARWRAQRQQFRTREYQEDVRDRQIEEDERAALERESEEFLKRQMAELAELEESQRARGLLTEDAAPIKLALNAAPITDIKPKEEKKPIVKSNIAFGADDEDDEDGEKKKKRTFVRLDAEEGEGLTEAEKIAKRNARLLEIKTTLPRDKRGLWKFDIEWAAISETAIKEKIRPFVQGKIKDFLGDLDQDLVDFVIEQLGEKKGAADFVDALEPILAEDAESFVIQLWRQLSFESAAYIAGLDTGTMMA